MSDYVRISVKTNLDQREIFQILVECLPDMSWRMGNSDEQGLYVSGLGTFDEQIQLWLNDQSAEISINVRGVVCADQERAIWKSSFVSDVMTRVLPKIGEVGPSVFF